MKAGSLAGLILVIFGVLALVYQGFTYTTRERVLDVGPIQATKEEHKTVPLPPIVGGLALIGGIVLMVAGNKEA
jgi:uncharacterized membrane protein